MTDTSPRAEEGYFSDLTARLAAADLAWAHQHGDPPSVPDYIRYLAYQVEAFEPRMDGPAVVERMAKAMYGTYHQQCADLEEEPQPYTWVPWRSEGPVAEFWDKVARAALVALRGDQS